MPESDVLTPEQRQRSVGDAILLERAMGVLDRRWRDVLLTEPAACAAYEMLRQGAMLLRREGESGVPVVAQRQYPRTLYRDAGLPPYLDQAT